MLLGKEAGQVYTRVTYPRTWGGRRYDAAALAGLRACSPSQLPRNRSLIPHAAETVGLSVVSSFSCTLYSPRPQINGAPPKSQRLLPGSCSE